MNSSYGYGGATGNINGSINLNSSNSSFKHRTSNHRHPSTGKINVKYPSPQRNKNKKLEYAQ
jgi:hypothetical protein